MRILEMSPAGSVFGGPISRYVQGVRAPKPSDHQDGTLDEKPRAGRDFRESLNKPAALARIVTHLVRTLLDISKMELKPILTSIAAASISLY